MAERRIDRHLCQFKYSHLRVTVQDEWLGSSNKFLDCKLEVEIQIEIGKIGGVAIQQSSAFVLLRAVSGITSL